MKILVLVVFTLCLASCDKSDDFNPYLDNDSSKEEKPVYSYLNVDTFQKDLPREILFGMYRADQAKYSETINSIRAYYVRKSLMKDRGMKDFHGREGVVAELLDIFKEDFDEKSTREYYEKNKDQFVGLDPKNDKDWLEKVKYSQLVNHITRNFIRKSKELADRGELVINILPPDIRTTGIDFSKYPSVGDKRARYKLFAVTNYFCDNCRLANNEVNDLFKIYGKDLQYTHIGHSFNVNDVSMDSILIGNCVAKESSELYWKFHSEVYNNSDFSNIKIFDNAKFKKRVGHLLDKIGANKKEVFKCMLDKDVRYAASDSLKFFKKLDITKVPTFFLNGRELTLEEFNSLKTGFDEMKRRLDVYRK